MFVLILVKLKDDLLMRFLSFNFDVNWRSYNHIFTDASKAENSVVGVGVFHCQYDIIKKIKACS